jgi:hypothetical protein
MFTNEINFAQRPSAAIGRNQTNSTTDFTDNPARLSRNQNFAPRTPRSQEQPRYFLSILAALVSWHPWRDAFLVS